MIDVNSIGQNIRSARNEKGLTQRQLSEQAEISQTQLSDYENGNKTPGLYTLAKLSLALGKSMDELFFGDASVSFISTAPDKGTAIVNCFIELWRQGVINTVESKNGAKVGHDAIRIKGHVNGIKRLMDNLYEFEIRETTYTDPKGYLDYVKSSIAKEINDEEERWEKEREFRAKHGLR